MLMMVMIVMLSVRVQLSTTSQQDFHARFQLQKISVDVQTTQPLRSTHAVLTSRRNFIKHSPRLHFRISKHLGGGNIGRACFPVSGVESCCPSPREESVGCTPSTHCSVDEENFGAVWICLVCGVVYLSTCDSSSTAICLHISKSEYYYYFFLL